MNGFGMYKGEKFRNGIRKKLLGFLDAMIRGDDDTLTPSMAGMYSAAFYDAMILFGDQLDLHN